MMKISNTLALWLAAAYDKKWYIDQISAVNLGEKDVFAHTCTFAFLVTVIPVLTERKLCRSSSCYEVLRRPDS